MFSESKICSNKDQAKYDPVKDILDNKYHIIKNTHIIESDITVYMFRGSNEDSSISEEFNREWENLNNIYISL